MRNFARRCGEITKQYGPNKASVSDTQNVHHVSEDTHKKYFKAAFVNGAEIDCYIDLGSSCTILKKDVADEMSISYLEDVNLNQLAGYGGGRVRPIGVTTLLITIDGVQAKTKVYIIEPEHQTVPLLVGHSFTEQPHINITIDSDGLTGGEHREFKHLHPETNDRTPLKVANTTVIPGGFIGHIRVVTNFSAMEINVDGQMRENGQVIPNCVISTNEDRQAIVPLFNCSQNDMSFTEGTVLTRGEVCIGHVNNDLLYRSSLNTEEIKEDEIITEDDNKTDVVALVNEFRDIVSKTTSQIGMANKVAMSINLKSPEKTVYYRPYRLSQHEREKVIEMIDEMKGAGIVEDSTSEFASPILLVRKKSGEFRLCVDYRELNKLTVKDHYPLPRIDDQLDNLGQKKYFSSLDLFSGYYQIPMAYDSKEKTAFITPDGHYQFRRMPFGLCNAPRYFSDSFIRFWATYDSVRPISTTF